MHFIRAGLPLAENVILTIKLFNLYKTRHKDQGMSYVRYMSGCNSESCQEMVRDDIDIIEHTRFNTIEDWEKHLR